MKASRVRNIFIVLLSIYTIFVVGFYFLAGEQLRYKEFKDANIPEADSITPEIIEGIEVKQNFVNKVDRINMIEMVFTKFYRDGNGQVTVSLIDEDTNEVFIRETLNVLDIPEQHRIYLEADEPIEGLKNETLTLSITSNCKEGEGVAVMMNEETEGSYIMAGGKILDGTLCFAVVGTVFISLSDYYWFIMGGLGIALAAIFLVSYLNFVKGKYNYIIVAIYAVERYRFLISQLVIRDFKTKYKRSILGVFWSFLNPLLTMTVQFLVFSTFFKSDTQNYPIYLLTGVVCFSFFSECTSRCLASITENSTLITKVYIPKYIFPLSRTISSFVNLGISLVPLFLACLVLGVAIRPQALLMFYFLGCLVVFALGISLFLSALMVFFRDIQFLWTVLIQIWNYATPIFYPAEIIPDKYRFIVRFNPLYHFIGNIRVCLMNGVSPEPMAYIWCLLFALVSFAIGAAVFKKSQDKFALYI